MAVKPLSIPEVIPYAISHAISTAIRLAKEAVAGTWHDEMWVQSIWWNRSIFSRD